MIEFIPAAFIFIFEIFLLVLWVKSRRNKDGKERRICLYGFLLGQMYILWEVNVVGRSGQPTPGSVEQKMLMARFLLGASLGGLFTIMGLFYLSFGGFPRRK